MALFSMGLKAFTYVTPTRVYTDASVKKGITGVGVYWADQHRVLSQPLRARCNDVTYAELFAIFRAIQCTDIRTPLIIYTDSRASMLHLAPVFHGTHTNKTHKYNHLLTHIHQYLSLRIGWTALHKVKAHSNIHGNDIADKMARLATTYYTRLAPNHICEHVPYCSNAMSA